MHTSFTGVLLGSAGQVSLFVEFIIINTVNCKAPIVLCRVIHPNDIFSRAVVSYQLKEEVHVLRAIRRETSTV